MQDRLNIVEEIVLEPIKGDVSSAVLKCFSKLDLNDGSEGIGVYRRL